MRSEVGCGEVVGPVFVGSPRLSADVCASL